MRSENRKTPAVGASLVTADRNGRETELGVFEDLDEARHRAVAYMADHPAGDERGQ